MPAEEIDRNRDRIAELEQHDPVVCLPDVPVATRAIAQRRVCSAKAQELARTYKPEFKPVDKTTPSLSTLLIAQSLRNAQDK